MSQNFQRIYNREWQLPRRTLTILALLGALLAAAPLWGPGIVNTRGGGDSPFLLQRTMEMAENLRHGIFPVRWMSHAAYGLGYPFFNHYAALPYYLSGGLTALGINPLSAIQATQTLGFLLTALAMARWTQRVFHNPAASLVATIAYTFAPFHLVNIYVRGDSLSEFYAFLWYPALLLALDQTAEHPRGRYIISASVAYAGLILTHNISALIFSPFALLYGLGISYHYAHFPPSNTLSRHTTLPRISAVLKALVGGVFLSAWFWLPAILETKYGQIGPTFTEGYFHYSNHFRGINLIQRNLAFNYSIATTVAAAGPFAMGLVQACLAGIGSGVMIFAIASSIAAQRRKKLSSSPPAAASDYAIIDTELRDQPKAPSTWQMTMLLVGLAGSTFMITPLSEPLWRAVPLLAMIQFPWRFLSIQALFTAAVTAAIAEPDLWHLSALHTRSQHNLRIAHWTTITSIVVSIVAALAFLHPDRLPIGPQDVTWRKLLFYETFTGNIGTTIRYEYLPRDVVPRLYISEVVIDGHGTAIADGDNSVEANLLKRTPTEQIWETSLTGESEPVAFPLNWWPGWQATIDGIPTPTYPMIGSGRLTMQLPEGHHTIRLNLTATQLEKGTAALSLITLSFFVVASVKANQGKRPQKAMRHTGLLTALAMLAIVGPLALQHPQDGPATFFDFEEMPYPHRGPIRFEGFSLSGVKLSSETLYPGSVLEAALTWTEVPAEPLTVTLRLVSPAEPRHGIQYTLAEASTPISTQSHIPLALPAYLSRGLYLLQLRVTGPSGELRAHTAGNHTMGPLYIAALTAPAGPQSPSHLSVLAGFRDLTLHSVETSQSQPDKLHVQMKWSTTGTPRNWRLSLRLLDADGRLIAQQDHQPGYGYLPTTLWRPGELVTDYAAMPLPQGLAPGQYTLRIITYLQANGEGGGEADVPIKLTVPTLYDLRSAPCEQARKGKTIRCQANHVALLGVRLPDEVREGETLHWSAEWNALQRPTTALSTTWTLLDSQGSVIGETSQPLAPGSKTSDWPRHTWVLAPVEITLPPRLQAGPYSLHLSIESKDGTVNCGQVATVTITSCPRSFTVPALSYKQDATFDSAIRFLGYAFKENHQQDKLELTLWWQAAATPEQDYKRFVHLYNPQTEEIVAQDDAMPRDWTYPTSWWVKGEVISESVTLDLSQVPPGEYRIGIGWYDPETLERLNATTASDQPLPNGRLTLSTPISIH